SCSTSMTKLKFERPFSNHLAFLHQNRLFLLINTVREIMINGWKIQLFGAPPFSIRDFTYCPLSSFID
ncbi:hypothetical protein, partial [Bacillus cereus]